MTDETGPTLTGAAYELANAGYTPMPEADDKDDREAIGSDSASLREAAEQLGDPQGNVIVRKYLDGAGKPVPASEAVSLSRASRDYADAAAADFAVAENESANAIAARVDALRAEALARDSDAAEFYGFELPQADGFEKSISAKTETDENAREPLASGDHAATPGLDPELEKALQHPQVRQTIEQQIGEAEQIRQDYRNGLVAATQIAQVSFLSQFPELASITSENLPGALELMSRQDPAKFARVQSIIASTEQLFAQQHEESGRQAELTRQNFERFAKTEDARLETMLKGDSRETQAAVSAEILASAKAAGVEGAEFMRLFNSEPLMRNAAFQHMMYDAGKYRLMMKARDAAAAKPLPPVQRPGMARSAAEREHADIRTLNARLSSSGDIKDAVALYHARKSIRR